MKPVNIFFASLIAFSVALAACKKDKKDDLSDDNSRENKAPTVSLTSPTDSPSDVTFPYSETFSAIASDEDGSISKVEFYLDDQKIGEDNTTPYSIEYQFNSADVYEVTAKAIDNEGASTVSASFTYSSGI